MSSYFSLPAVENNNANNYKLACESAAVGAVHVGAVPERNGACPSIKTERAVKLCQLPYFRWLAIAREQPGNCRRCGKPNRNGFAHCDACRKYMASYKTRRHCERFKVPSEVAKELAQFRRELSRLRATVKNMANERRRAYRRGYAAGLAGKRARLRKSAWVPPQMSKQELAQISSAWTRPLQ